VVVDMVAQVVVDIVAAEVAEVDMGLAGGCLAVHARPLYRDNTLALPSLRNWWECAVNVFALEATKDTYHRKCL
jgi:hypothetical protein